MADMALFCRRGGRLRSVQCFQGCSALLQHEKSAFSGVLGNRQGWETSSVGRGARVCWQNARRRAAPDTLKMNDTKLGQGRGIATLGECGVLSAWQALPAAAPLEIVEPDNWLASPDCAAAPLLEACVAQFDLRLAQACTRKLAVRMADDGREDAKQVTGDCFPSVVRDDKGAVVRRSMGWPIQWQDACAAGVLAVQLWRNRSDGFNPFEPVQRVCWRAVVSAISADTFGDGEQFVSPGDDWLWVDAQAVNKPCSDDDAGRAERAAMLRVSRASAPVTLTEDFAVNIGAAAARAWPSQVEANPGKCVLPAHAPGAAIVIPAGTVISGRIKRLGKRVESLMAGKRRRADTVERVGRACVFLLQGETLDGAATLAGFKASGKGRHAQRAGDNLAAALRRVGVRFVRDARARDGWDGELDKLKLSQAVADGRGFCGFNPVQADSHVAAWHDWQSLPASAHVSAWQDYLASQTPDERTLAWLGSPALRAARLTIARDLHVSRVRLKAWRRARALA